MTTHAIGTFDIKTWDEKPYDEQTGLPKLTRASVTASFQGDVEATATIEFLMTYRDDSFAAFIGLFRLVGSIGGRSGSFVMQDSGTFENSLAKGAWIIIPGLATGDLSGLRGEGGYGAKQDDNTFTLDYYFE